MSPSKSTTSKHQSLKKLGIDLQNKKPIRDIIKPDKHLHKKLRKHLNDLDGQIDEAMFDE